MKYIPSLLIVLFASSCYNTFSNKEKVKTSIKKDDFLLEWIEVEEKFFSEYKPDFIRLSLLHKTLSIKTEIICKSDSIFNMEFNENRIKIYTFGSPRYFKNEAIGVKIEIDSSIVNGKATTL